MAQNRRLIDADALIADKDNYVSSTWGDAITAQDIDTAPTVDAVEVVRCKDCKWFKKGAPFRHKCKKIDGGMFFIQPDDFCSYGERRNNEAN